MVIFIISACTAILSLRYYWLLKLRLQSSRVSDHFFLLP